MYAHIHVCLTIAGPSIGGQLVSSATATGKAAHSVSAGLIAVVQATL